MRCLKHCHKNTYLNLPQTQVITLKVRALRPSHNIQFTCVRSSCLHHSGPWSVCWIFCSAQTRSLLYGSVSRTPGLLRQAIQQVLSFVPACSATLVLFYITLPLSLYCFKAALTPSVWLIIPSSLPPAPPKNSAKMRVQSFLSVFFLCFPLRSCQIRITLCEQSVRVAML